MLVKQIAKQGVKKGIQMYAKDQIQKRLSTYMSKSMVKQFAKDLEGVLNTLDDAWWETALEFFPGAGDLYGAGKFAKKVLEAYDKLQDLENKYVGKIYDALPSSQKKDFKNKMRSKGVKDAQKDQKEVFVKIRMKQSTLEMELLMVIT